MAVIGGIFNSDMALCHAGTVLDMSRTMLVRGGMGRYGYINRGIGIFSGRGRADSENCLCAFHGGDSNEKNITAVVDGSPKGGGRWDDYGAPKEVGAELVLSAYIHQGARLGESLGGEFSAALFDEARGELILLRDSSGSRPLFYAKEGSTVAFASEIKGIMRFMTGTAVVELCRLREHLFSPHVRGGADIYRDIYEIPRSGGCICSRPGVEVFAYSAPADDNADYISGIVEEKFVCPDKNELRNILRDVLFAFDYPEFDVLMPTFIDNLGKIRRGKRGFVAIEDGTLCIDLDYSLLRKDRLCSHYGGYARCIPPKNGLIKERELKSMERIVWQLLDEVDKSSVRRVFGENVEEIVRCEKSTAKRIRAAAILYQTALWQKNYNLIFV